MADDEYFGAPPQQEMQRIAASLWPLLRDNPRYAYEGRFVSLDDPAPVDVDTLAALCRVQGGTCSFNVDAANETAIVAGLKNFGLMTDRWDQLITDEAGVAVCRAVLAQTKLPDGFTLVEIDRTASPERMAALAATSLASGVMPPAGPALRGVTRDAVAFGVCDASGEVVSVSGAVARHERGSPFADSAWWGMLATREAHRGRGLSKYVGAVALVAMAERFGKRRFYTGVRTDNAASQKLCRQLGLTDSGRVCIAALDPARFGNVQLSR